MTAPRSRVPSRAAIGPRPSDAARAATWVRQGDRLRADALAREVYTARLTIDVTPALRGRIKVSAFERGETVAAMLRELLVREFGEDKT